ncbi:MAG: N-acetylmuramoyl-L-alanine amidase-like domain-containing protein, partial [Bacteroidota bacterium]
FFLGTEYVAGTLEYEGEEILILNLRELDCTTYIENVIAIAQNISEKKYSFGEYLQQLTRIRYRGDTIGLYPSRLHYFSDWLYDNTKEGLIKIIEFPDLSEPYEKEINFMSTHTESYDKLNNPEFVEEIIDQENRINKRIMNYTPQEKVQMAGRHIKTGDLIAITTNIDGLDIMHTGFAVDINGSIHLIHASSLQKKVMISPRSLHEMINNNKLMSGIIVARIQL